MTSYNLSIACVDGYTIYGVISSDKKLLMNFLDEHDHEGSSLTLVKHYGEVFEDIPYDKIYDELKED